VRSAKSRPAGRAVTISDVAAAAGVSNATVSRVLNGAATVDAALASRVRDVIEQIGYRPNAIARNLRRATTSVWCLIISDIRNPFFTDVVRGIEDRASAAGFSLVLCNSDEDLEKESVYLDLAVAERMGGVIIAPTSSTETTITRVLESGIPVVAMDRLLEHDPIDAVVVDSVAGARAATAHLLASGFTRVACVTGPLDTTSGAGRLEGWRLAHADAGVEVDEALIATADFMESGGRAAATTLLARSPRPDAFFVANNLMTLGVLEALDDAGLAVPADAGLVSFDDPAWARLMHPALTSIAQPTYEMGVRAADLLTRRLDGDTGPPERIVMPPELRVRESSRRPEPSQKCRTTSAG
jgi:LacI family transcriptional regulator